MLKPVGVFTSPNKISGCTASIYQKSLWFVFDLIYVVIISSSHGRPQGGETGICRPLEIRTKSQKFLENLKSAALF